MQVPTLDPTQQWTPDESAGKGVYKSGVNTSKRTEKQVQHKVLYEATKEHPAQIERWNEDVPVAAIETIHTSGMWTPRRKSDVLARLGKLLTAVKKARQRANTVEVEYNDIGGKLFDYILFGNGSTST